MIASTEKAHMGFLHKATPSLLKLSNDWMIEEIPNWQAILPVLFRGGQKLCHMPSNSTNTPWFTMIYRTCVPKSHVFLHFCPISYRWTKGSRYTEPGLGLQRGWTKAAAQSNSRRVGDGAMLEGDVGLDAPDSSRFNLQQDQNGYWNVGSGWLDMVYYGNCMKFYLNEVVWFIRMEMV